MARVHDLSSGRSSSSSPIRNRAISSIGFCVAERPIRSGRHGQSAPVVRATGLDDCRVCRVPTRGSRLRSRSRLRSSSRLRSAVMTRYSDSGVVTKMCGGLRSTSLPFGGQTCRPCARRPNLRTNPASLAGQIEQFLQRRLQIPLNVVGIGPRQGEDAEAGTKALLGMRPGRDDGLEKGRGRRTDFSRRRRGALGVHLP